MLRVDLTNHLNWNRLGTWFVEGERRESGRFAPPPPVSAVAPSPLILVGGINHEAPSAWTLAGWCQASISCDPGSTASLFGLATLPRQAISLNRFALILQPQFEGVSQYVYTFYPAKWFPNLTIEAWWYDGAVIDTTSAGINRLIQELL